MISSRICGATLLLCLAAASICYVDGAECNFEKNDSGYRWRVCSPNNSTTKEKCIQQNCCYNSTLNTIFPGVNCWRKEKSEGGIKNGTCLAYTGTVCADSFNQSMLSTAPRRLFDQKYQVNGTDRIMIALFNIFKNLKIDDKCRSLLEGIACPFVMPECTSDDTVLKPCREDCEYLATTCNKDSQVAYALGQIDFILLSKGYNFYHIDASRLLTCNLYQYSYDPDVRCMKLLKGSDRSKPPDNKKIIIIAGAAGGAAFLVFILCVIFCCYRRNERLKKEKLYQTEMEYVSNMTSIREHIRSADSTVNPLMELLASSKPGELIQYPVDCIEYVKELGEGQFGKVFQGRVHGVVKGEESTDVAVKCLKEGSSDVAKASFNQEVALMSVLQHNNILKLLAVSTEEEPYCMIFEFMEKGDLNEYLRQWNSKEYLNDSQLIKVCKHVAAGMEYLASKKFLHRDLATRNCLVGKDLMVKIADFGMSRNVYHSDYYRVGGEAMLPIRWMPPESILYGKFTVASDVYSFGVVMWEIFSFALQPFYGYGNEEVIEFIKKGVLLPKPEDCPEWIYNIMLNCWKTDVEERITFTRVFQMLKAKDVTTADNYDRLPSEVRLITEGDISESNPPSSHEGYDRVTMSQQTPQKTHNDYDKVWNEPAKKIPEDFNQTPGYINLPNIEKESPKRQALEDLPRSPSTDPGSPNMGFDDDERKLLRPQSTSSLPKGSPSLSLKDLTPKALKRNKNKQQEFQSNEALLHRRSIGSRSIKDVVKGDNNGPRYVTSDDVKRISQHSDKQSHPEDGHEDEPEYTGAFRPTSEFLPFHGYGESIQAKDPDEAKLIKKIIEESN